MSADERPAWRTLFPTSSVISSRRLKTASCVLVEAQLVDRMASGARGFDASREFSSETRGRQSLQSRVPR